MFVTFGSLKNVAGAPSGAGWTGTITASHVENTDVLDREQPDEFFKSADLSAPARCIDGRPSRRRRNVLSAQVPGGTVGDAMAWRLVNGAPASAVLSDDIHAVDKVFRAAGLGVGGHTDDASHPDGGTGCGAIDKLPAVLAHCHDPLVRRQITRLTSLLLGRDFNAKVLEDVLALIETFSRNHAGAYFSEADNYAYRIAALAALRDDAAPLDPIERLTGTHAELAVFLNLAEGTTFDRDAFTAARSDRQLFNYDVWHTFKAADVLFPGDEAARNHFIVCRIVLAVTTLMLLTDGTLPLIARQ